MPHPGKLITFEGTEGSGKSTLIQGLAKELRRRGHRVTVTREPGGSPVAEKIRDLILKTQMNPWTELFLYEASRIEHLHQTILPALKRGDLVLCDRYTDSSLAYQGAGRGLPQKTITLLNQVATQRTSPSLTFLLNLDPRVGLKRAQDKNRFEDEKLRFHLAVQRGFLRLARHSPKRWRVISVENQNPVQVLNAALKALETKRWIKR